MHEKMKLDTPKNIKVTILCYKPDKVLVDFDPEYHQIEISGTKTWVEFSYELEGLTDDQI